MNMNDNFDWKCEWLLNECLNDKCEWKLMWMTIKFMNVNDKYIEILVACRYVNWSNIDDMLNVYIFFTEL